MLEYVPLVVVILLGVGLSLAQYTTGGRRRTTRVALALFADEPGTRDPSARVLQAAHIATPIRIYVARTRLFASVTGIIGALTGVYLGASLLTVLTGEAARTGSGPLGTLGQLLTMAATDGPVSPGISQTFLFLTLGSVVVGILGSTSLYALRRYVPRSRAETRRRDIEANMPRLIAFVYALSRGGMAFPEVLRALSRNEGVFGEGAAEAGIAVRNVDLFGSDIVSSLRQLAERTPSDQFRTFLENVTSVLQSGRDLPEFLEGQYRRYREEAEQRQDELLEQLATTAEVYVTVVVAGMLFLITILLIIGLTAGDTLTFMALSTYLALPGLNVLFIAYLNDLTSPLRARRERQNERPSGRRRPSIQTPRSALPDGGLSQQSLLNRERLRQYQAVNDFRGLLRRPVRSVTERPYRILYLSLPLAMGYVAYIIVPQIVVLGVWDVAAFDDTIVVGLVVVMASYALVYERSRRRLDEIEAALPDLLDRLASLNEAGVTIVKSFDRVRESDIGIIEIEVDRIWSDIQWGLTVEEALERFEDRVKTPAVTRLVTLVSFSMRSSNEIGAVLRIAAEQARRDQRFKRARRQETFTYLVAIYVAFLVFILVIVSIDAFFIPQLLEATQQSGGETTIDTVGGFAFVTAQVAADYRLVFFHAALVQAVLSGLVGGQMSQGNVRDGVKHATIMLVLTYVVFELVRASI